MKIDQLKKFFEDNDFKVHLSKQDGNQCAELEAWTRGGVNMFIWLNPFTADEFKRQVINFDVDDEIDAHREDPAYKSAFSIAQSLEDFQAFQYRLMETEAKL